MFALTTRFYIKKGISKKILRYSNLPKKINIYKKSISFLHFNCYIPAEECQWARCLCIRLLCYRVSSVERFVDLLHKSTWFWKQ